MSREEKMYCSVLAGFFTMLYSWFHNITAYGFPVKGLYVGPVTQYFVFPGLILEPILGPVYRNEIVGGLVLVCLSISIYAFPSYRIISFYTSSSDKEKLSFIAWTTPAHIVLYALICLRLTGEAAPLFEQNGDPGEHSISMLISAPFLLFETEFDSLLKRDALLWLSNFTYFALALLLGSFFKRYVLSSYIERVDESDAINE